MSGRDNLLSHDPNALSQLLDTLRQFRRDGVWAMARQLADRPEQLPDADIVSATANTQAAIDAVEAVLADESCNGP